MRDGGAVRAGSTGDGVRRHIMPRSVTFRECCAATSGHGGLARFMLTYKITPTDREDATP